MHSLALALALAMPCCPPAVSSNPSLPLQSPPAKASLRKPALERVTLINMSGKDCKACLGKLRVDLPVAQPVVLQLRLGDTLRVVSDTDSNLDERFLITEADATRSVAVR